VLKFLGKLDPIRHGTMVAHLENTQRSGGAFPATVDAAYLIAKEWKAPATAANFRTGRVESAFLLADELVFYAPPKAHAAPAAVQTAAPVGPVAPTEKRARGPPRAVETRICHNCNQVGHLRKYCPHRVMVAVGDEGGEDEESQLALRV
jgi:hypothetical protein